MRNFSLFFGKMYQARKGWLLILVMMTLHLPAFSQYVVSNHSLSANTYVQDQQRSLDAVLIDLEETFDVSIVFDNAIIRGKKVDASDIVPDDLEKSLVQLLKPLGLESKKIEEKVYVIKPSQPHHESIKKLPRKMEVPNTSGVQNNSNMALPFLNQTLKKYLMEKVVSGQVTDLSSDENLPGVNVLVKGSQTGTVTDVDGNYRLTVPDDAEALIFSFVGYITEEVPIGNQSEINISLTPDVQSLEELVVVGYGTQKKVNLTGAVSTVDSEVLEDRPITNLGQGLQGQISNLNITQNTGSLGGGASFNIRGFTSINGGEPLILVNNVPMDINLINPSDIESVTVLKDAASSAIYGARAAYGVILITTKSGKISQKPSVSLSMNYAVNTPVLKFETMDALERMNYMNTANMARNGVPYYQFTDIQAEALLAHYYDPTQPTAIPDPANPNVWLRTGNTNWPKELLRDSYPQQQYSASVSGGSDKFDYYASLSYLNQEGIARQFDERFQRYNFMTNLNYDITDWINIGTKVSINNSNKYYPPNNSANHHPENNSTFQWHQWANWPVYNPDGNYASGGSVPNMVQFFREAGYRERDILDTWLTGSAVLTPIKNMTFNIQYSTNFNNAEEEEYWKRLPMFYVDGTISGYFPYTNPSQVTRRQFKERYHVFNAFADYENTFGKHGLKLMVGFNQENLESSFFSAKRENLTVETIPYLNLAFGEDYVDDGASEYAIRGVFSRVNYNFDDKYLFEFNGRYDGSSKFPKKDRFAFFPSASVGWRVDNEFFFEGLKSTINLLKLRASYGSLGNQNVPGNYPYISTFTAGTVNYVIDGERPLTVYAPGLVSPTLTWETVTQRNFGVDFTMFDYRLDVTFDVYRRDTKNMLTRSETLPAVLAVSEPQANAADLKTSGFDLTVGWREETNNMNWGVKLILSDYTSEITKFSNPVGLISDYYVGQDIGEIWGLVTAGIAQTDDEAKAIDQSNVVGYERKAGDLVFEDINGDGRITYGDGTLDNPGDRKIIGNNTPRYSFGFKSDFKWKGFDLDIFFQGVAKRDMWLSPTFWIGGYNDEWRAHNKVLNDWWSPDNTDAYFPRPVITGGTDVTATQTRYLQDASYLRLKQLTLGYTIPSDLTQRINIEKVRVYFSGNNVWEVTGIYKYRNVADPEMNGSQFYPINRSFSIGANINF